MQQAETVDGGIKRGYLEDVHRYFHLKDQIQEDFESHHHDFCKIVILISGNVDYVVEGKTYRLRPWDILFINHIQVHQPIIDSTKVYERIVLWIDPASFRNFNSEEFDVLSVFQKINAEGSSLLRLPLNKLEIVKEILNQIEQKSSEDHITKNISTNLLVVQLLILFYRLSEDGGDRVSGIDIKFDESVMDVISYINDHLHDELLINDISQYFFASKYHLMRKFKQQTGFTIHQYILQKRLLLSKKLILSDLNMTEVCIQSGFSDYTTFFRTFKKEFGMSPKKYAQQAGRIQLFEKSQNDSL